MRASLSKQDGSPSARLFVAVPLPPSLRSELGAVRELFGPLKRCLKWVAPESMHITVKFLGEVATSKVDATVLAIRGATSSVSPFHLKVQGLGAFPRARAPRVLWAGLEEDQGKSELSRLQGSVEDALAPLGFERERRAYAPHITIARARENVSVPERAAMGTEFERVREHHDVQASVDVEELLLMQSILTPSGPRYTQLGRFPLRHTVRGQDGDATDISSTGKRWT